MSISNFFFLILYNLSVIIKNQSERYGIEYKESLKMKWMMSIG